MAVRPRACVCVRGTLCKNSDNHVSLCDECSRDSDIFRNVRHLPGRVEPLRREHQRRPENNAEVRRSHFIPRLGGDAREQLQDKSEHMGVLRREPPKQREQ